MTPTETPPLRDWAAHWLSDEAWFAGLARQESGAMHAIVVDLGDLATAEPGEPILRLLDAEEQARADRFRFPKDRTQFVMAHALLRIVAGCAIGLSGDRLAGAVRASFGKAPEVTGDPPRPRLSLSHAGAYVGIALGWQAPIGIDVEMQHRALDLDLLARGALNEQEARDLAALPEAERVTVFLRWWTAKEAALKTEGAGFSISPAAVTLAYDRAHRPIAASVPVDGTRHDHALCVLDPFGPLPVVATVAASGYASLALATAKADAILRRIDAGAA